MFSLFHVQRTVSVFILSAATLVLFKGKRGSKEQIEK